MDPLIAIAGGYQVRESNVTPGLGVVVPACKADPNRWALMMCVSAGGNMTVALGVPSATNGIVLTGSNFTVTFNVRDHASLPQLGWNVMASGGGTLTVYEISRLA